MPSFNIIEKKQLQRTVYVTRHGVRAREPVGDVVFTFQQAAVQ